MIFDINDLIEVNIKAEDDFLKIKETLTRIGIATKWNKKLYQSCHILHKRGRYFIVHFKELFALDGKRFDISDDDLGRRNTIVRLLEEWGLVTILDRSQTDEPLAPIAMIKVLPYKEKVDWELISKYSIGRKRVTGGDSS